jgi:glycine/D-amino acid oxidase-like deaminating enzyme/nitrite reductase/ring-hydroxylating ferredoxin subunit
LFIRMATRTTTSYAGTLPYWEESSFPSFPKLEQSLTADVLVIGGGITGLTTAYLLATAGKSVVLLERHRCAHVDTGHTTAHLTMVTDTRMKGLVDRFGRPHAQAVWDAGLAALAQIDTVVREHDIECGFEWVTGYLHAPSGDATRDDGSSFRDEAALTSELGFDAAFVENVPFVGGPGIRFEDQARFHPRKYLAGLAKAAAERGVRIFEESEAGDFSDDPRGVKVNGYRVRAKDIVIATHNPLVGLASMSSATTFQTKLALYTSYVVAGRVPHGVVPDALFWDTGDPYQYLRVDRYPDYDIVIFGGEDHKTGQQPDTNACYARLERALAERIPGFTVTYRWSGQVIETPDGLPYIGRMTDHQYAATGFAGNGMTYGTLSGVLIADAIDGRKNPWAELFDPGRAAIRRGLWEYIKENADYPYYLVRDRFAGVESRSLRSVKRGQGKLIEHKGAKVAAFRGVNGELMLRSATCTHMGCVVGWNEAERTWDCPCHGSRFTTEGQVISGPAEKALPEIDP